MYDEGAEYAVDHAIDKHAESTDHSIHPRDAQILECAVTKFHKRLFLESWYSTLDNITTTNGTRTDPLGSTTAILLFTLSAEVSSNPSSRSIPVPSLNEERE